MQLPSEVQWKILSPVMTLGRAGILGHRRFSEAAAVIFPLSLVQSHEQDGLDLRVLSQWRVIPSANKKFYSLTCSAKVLLWVVNV